MDIICFFGGGICLVFRILMRKTAGRLQDSHAILERALIRFPSSLELCNAHVDRLLRHKESSKALAVLASLALKRPSQVLSISTLPF